jgi:large subunit ribosomal protein L23
MSTSVKPVVTEKSSKAVELNKFTFWVSDTVNKIAVRQAFEKKYGVKVISLNSVNVKGKQRRRGKFVGKTKDRKKVIITVAPGSQVDEIKKLF